MLIYIMLVTFTLLINRAVTTGVVFTGVTLVR